MYQKQFSFHNPEKIMNLSAFLAALAELIPAIGSFIKLAHPTDGEAARVQTATNIANAGLATAGVAAETIAALAPVVASAVAPATSMATTGAAEQGSAGQAVTILGKIGEAGTAVAAAIAAGTAATGNIPGVLVPPLTQNQAAPTPNAGAN